MNVNRYGATFHNGTQVVSLIETPKDGWIFLVRAKRQEIEVRVTPSGLIRVSQPRCAGPITADGAPVDGGQS